MKKILMAAGISLLLSSSVWAATDTPLTLTDRMDSLDRIVYGDIQDGSLVERVNAVDVVVYGKKKTSDDGLDDRVVTLYNDVVKNNDDTQPSLSMRVNALEYYLSDKIQLQRLEERVEALEDTVYGKQKKGSLVARVTSLEETIYGNKHYEMKTVELPENTVFKISLNEDVGTDFNAVGDSVTFSVEQDVLVGDVVVLPRGAQGSGVVTKVTKPKSFGRSGSLDISFNQVFSIDGDSIPTVLGPEAREKLKMEAAAVGASVAGAVLLGPVGLVGGFFVKGKDMELSAGSKLYIQTEKTVTTKGLVLQEGAATAVLRDNVNHSAVVTDEDDVFVDTTDGDEVVTEVKESVPDVEKTVSEEEKKAENTVKDESESLKEESESLKEKAKEKEKEVTDKAEDVAKVTITRDEADDEEPSVVIIRDE